MIHSTPNSSLRPLSEQITNDKMSYEVIVALTVHNGTLIIATNRDLYRVDGTRITKLTFSTGETT